MVSSLYPAPQKIRAKLWTRLKLAQLPVTLECFVAVLRRSLLHAAIGQRVQPQPAPIGHGDGFSGSRNDRFRDIIKQFGQLSGIVHQQFDLLHIEARLNVRQKFRMQVSIGRDGGLHIVAAFQ